MVDHDLPKRNHTQNYIISRILNFLPCAGGQRGIVGDEPKKVARTQQYSSHFRKVAKNFFRQWRVEISRHNELAFGESKWTRIDLFPWLRLQNGKQTGAFIRQAFRIL